ncbi:MAG: pyrroline-5-carboxylate reductase [Oleiphilaceae bacterium]|jgi:pyrroline-5-carboxylate reductase
MGLHDKKICFVGAGNMANAIIGGLVQNGFSAHSIIASSPSEEHLQQIKSNWGVQTSSDNAASVKQADVIVLSVKPQVLKQVCEQLSANLKHRPLIISIAAGIELNSLNAWLGLDQSIVRCMPNTPAQVLKGASGLISNEHVSEEQKALSAELFSGIGIVEWLLNEAQMHSVTALSGSGPAYIFLMIEAMEAAAIKQGIDAGTARKLAAQTVLGAAQMVLDSDISPGQLKQNVMSPGGTTERAIQVFEQSDLSGIVDKAMQAAADRSEELAAILSGNKS